MTVGRGLQVLGGFLVFGAASSLMNGMSEGPQYYGAGAMAVIGLLLIVWGGDLHNKKR